MFCETKKKDSSSVLARVGNNTLTLKKLQKTNPKKRLNKDLIRELVSGWVNNTALLTSAKESGFDKDSALLKRRDAFFNDLMVSSFVDHELGSTISISNADVLNYYKKNKESFVRETDEVSLEHFITKKSMTAQKIKEALFSNQIKNKKITISDYLIETITLRRGRTNPQFENQIFLSTNPLVGPVRSEKGHHVFKIINRYKKGSYLGVDLVYDEIYQRLYKQKRTANYLLYLDSIKNQTKIYINPKYQ